MNRRAWAPTLLAIFVFTSCASGGGFDRALVEAGRKVRREQPPPTAAELRLEVDSFLDNELPLLRKRAEQRIERAQKIWRATFVGGAALGVLAASSGSIAGSGDAAKASLVGAGGAAMILGGVDYYMRAPRHQACIAFLAAARNDLSSWRSHAIPPGDGPVATVVWHAWVDRVASIRAAEPCAKSR
jgi:hypothetical protein